MPSSSKKKSSHLTSPHKQPKPKLKLTTVPINNMYNLHHKIQHQNTTQSITKQDGTSWIISPYYGVIYAFMTLFIRLCVALESSGEGCYDDAAACAALKFCIEFLYLLEGFLGGGQVFLCKTRGFRMLISG